MHLHFFWNFQQDMFILTICFIVLNVYRYVEVVLIYRPHPVELRIRIHFTLMCCIRINIRNADPNKNPGAKITLRFRELKNLHSSMFLFLLFSLHKKKKLLPEQFFRG